ncbi:MAG: hypothetical protein WCK18_13655 [Prolixibacteraceae bacterium]
MKAIEISTKTDKHGHLRINYPLNNRDSNVRIIILVDENSDDVNEEELWMKTISTNPAFDFLKDTSENIYSLTDGEPLDDKKKIGCNK